MDQLVNVILAIDIVHSPTECPGLHTRFMGPTIALPLVLRVHVT